MRCATGCRAALAAARCAFIFIAAATAITTVAAAPVATVIAATAGAAAADEVPTPQRVEARSTDLLAVGLVHGDRMSIHLSRLIDNSPVRDATVTVVLRGASHPTIAEVDGSYTLRTKDLEMPGAAGLEFQVAQASGPESLKGTLRAGAGHPDDRNNARQMWWWVLNFAVCIGFLWLISRRRKAAQT